MTKIVYEEDGFTLEQKDKGKEFKTFINFDFVSNKTGYYKNTNHQNIIMVMIFSFVLVLELINFRFRPTILFYSAVIIYFTYEFIKNFSRYKTLSLTNSKDIYFKKNEYHYIDEILEKRNQFFHKKYFVNIDKYNKKDRIYTINWLYKEGVINKEDVEKLKDFRFDEAKNEFTY